MSKVSRQILTGALILIFLTSACGELTFASPTPVWTVTPAGQPSLPTATILDSTPTGSTEMTITPLIPLTGENVVSMQCQFCVDEESHAILIFPDFAYFDVSPDTPVSCLTADVTGGRRILICHGTQSTTFRLNVCSDPENCLEFPVALQPCPLLQAGTPQATGTAFFLTPINTLKAPTREPSKPEETDVPSATPTPQSVPSTPSPPVNTPTVSSPLPTVASPISPSPPPAETTPPTQSQSTTDTPEPTASTETNGRLLETRNEVY